MLRDYVINIVVRRKTAEIEKAIVVATILGMDLSLKER